MAARTLAQALDIAALRSPARLALVSPFERTAGVRYSMDYGTLQSRTMLLAAGLANHLGYREGDVLLSSLPNVGSNLLLQLACSRLGVAFATVKDEAGIAALAEAGRAPKGSVAATREEGDATFWTERTHWPVVGEDGLEELVVQGKEVMNESGTLYYPGEHNPLSAAQGGGAGAAHAYFGGSAAYSNEQLLADGADAARELGMTQDDKVCVSITLCHAFGIGSAVGSALLSGAAVVLPAVGGIRGCGVPAERAAATLSVLESEACTLLFADTHTLKALPPPTDAGALRALRGGVCKTGSGAAFLDEELEYAGVAMRTVGKPAGGHSHGHSHGGH